MEALLLTKGLVSLHRRPKIRRGALGSPALPPFSAGFVWERRELQSWKVEAAAAADGFVRINDKKEMPKFLGVEVQLLKKIIPLGVHVLLHLVQLHDSQSHHGCSGCDG